MILTIILLLTTALAATVFIVTRALKGAGVWGLLTKTLASFCMVTAAIIALIYQLISYQSIFMLVALGLLCGMIGDILLELKVIYKEHSGFYLNCGYVAFGAGHLLYLAAISRLAVVLGPVIITPLLSALGAAIVLTVLIMFVSKKVMHLHFGKHYYPTIAYTFLLTFATVYTLILGILDTRLLLMAAGILLILLSDIVLSQQYFGTKENSRLYHILNHSIYYLGQICILAFILVFSYMV